MHLTGIIPDPKTICFSQTTRNTGQNTTRPQTDCYGKCNEETKLRNNKGGNVVARVTKSTSLCEVKQHLAGPYFGWVISTLQCSVPSDT